MVQIVAPAGYQQAAEVAPPVPATVDEAQPAAPEFAAAVEPPPSFTPPITLLQRPAVLMAAGGAALVLAAGLFVALTSRGGDDGNSPRLAAAVEPVVEPPTSDETEVIAADDATAEPVGTKEPVIKEPVAQPADTLAVAPAFPELPSDPIATDEAGDDSDLAATEELVKETPPPVESPRGPRLVFDPLDFDPARLRLSSSGA